MAWLLLTLALAADGDAGVSNNLLTSASLRSERGVLRSSVVRDNMLVFEGDDWDTEWTAKLDPAGQLEFDLGSNQPIQAIAVQVDNNDTYIVSGSDDGTTWRVLWKSEFDPLPGMRTRVGKNLGGHARYLKVTAEGGDRLYSISELRVYADVSLIDVDSLPRRPLPERPSPRFDSTWVYTFLLIALFVFYFWNRLREANAAPPPAAPDGKA